MKYLLPLLLSLGLVLASCAPYSAKHGKDFLYPFKEESGYYHTWKKGDSLDDLGKEAGVTALDIRIKNTIIEEADLDVGMLVYIPVKNKKVFKNKVRFPDEVPNFKLYGEGLAWPSPGTLTSKFGKRWGRKHEGIDMGQNNGLTIVAAGPGVVEFEGRQRGYGKTVIIDHGRGVKTLYAHASRTYVREGDKVTKGQKITKMGRTGKSTGVHLHFEVRIKGVARDPLKYLPSR
ncbi:MAG: M23 family metallopeptidase [SAR324 cluster bacterium]|nr:M23 family metallopeptidase [SAR324 cluster bacterium]